MHVHRRAPRLLFAALAAALVAPVLGTTGVASASDGGAIEAYWQARGGSSSSLGAPVSALTCDSLGCERTFTTGAVVWTATRGAKAVEGQLYNTWLTAGGRTGTLGLPTAEMDCTLRDAGCGQPFLKGAAYWSAASGTHVVQGAILNRWRALGAENSPLGYPTSSEQSVTGGVRAAFEGGAVYWSAATGPRMVRTAILAHYESLGGPAALGFPVSDHEPVAGGGERVRFQRGHVYYTAGTGAHVVEGAVLSVYNAQGAQTGPLGYPLSDEEAVAGGVRARFQNGTIYWSGATGARVVRGSILTKYESFGGPAQLGFPVADSGPTSDGRGTTVRLQRGTIYASGGPAHVVEGAILARYRELGASAGFLGFPSSDEQAVTGGVVSHFQTGALYWSSVTGARLVTGVIKQRYVELGGPAVMGFPVADEARTPDGGAMLRTQRGIMYWSPRTGAHFLEGAILSRWLAEGGPAGRLGYPESGEFAVHTGGVNVYFERGSMHWSPTTGARVVTGAISARYEIAGGPGRYSFPIADEERTADGTGALLRLQRGAVIYWSPSSGAHIVEGAILDRWRSLGAHTGPLGFPLSGEYAVTGGGSPLDGGGGDYAVAANFQGGTVYWSAATGARVVKGAIRQKYEAFGGALRLGLPTTDERPAVGGAVSDFEDGAIYWSPRTGAHVVEGETLYHWRQLGGETGALGYPVSDPEPHVDGIETGFERGGMIEHPDGSVSVYYTI